MTELLSQSEIESSLAGLSADWALSDNSLEREFKFTDFKSALEFVNKVGQVAEELNHHPDISLGWGRVSVKITSHESGGITKVDFKLAAAVDLI